MENLENNNNHDNDNNTKYKMYFIEGVGWIGSVVVLIPYVFPFTKTIDFG
jgi:hypothetical protein